MKKCIKMAVVLSFLLLSALSTQSHWSALRGSKSRFRSSLSVLAVRTEAVEPFSLCA